MTTWWKKVLVSFLCMGMVQAKSELQPITLTRLSIEGVAQLGSQVEQEMSKLRKHVSITVGVAGIGIVGAIYLDKRQSRSKQSSNEGAIEFGHKLIREMGTYYYRENSWTYSFARVLLFTIAASAAGVVWASWQDVADSLAASVKRSFLGLSRGYQGWFLLDLGGLEKDARSLYKALVTGLDATEEVRRGHHLYAPPFTEAVKGILGYRGDMIRRYERLCWRMNRVLGALVCMVPANKKVRVVQDINIVVGQVNMFAEQLEKDLNDATSNVMVEYSEAVRKQFVTLCDDMYGRLSSYVIRASA